MRRFGRANRPPAARSDEGLRDAVSIHDPDAAFPTIWTSRPLRLPILTAWAGGPKAVALSGRTKSELQQAAIKSIAGIFGQKPAKISSLLERCHVYDWPPIRSLTAPTAT